MTLELQIVSYDLDTENWYAEALWAITGEAYADAYKGGIFGGLKPKMILTQQHLMVVCGKLACVIVSLMLLITIQQVLGKDNWCWRC